MQLLPILTSTLQDLGASPSPDGLLVKTLYASFDPFVLGRMRSPDISWAYSAFRPGDTVETYTLAKVIKSASAGFEVGAIVRGLLLVQGYSFVSKEAADKLEQIEITRGLEPALYLGTLSMPGLSAYSSLYDIGKPRRGETILVSSAAGAVGQLVGQLAKHEGLKVLGSVGSQEKLDYLVTELAFDGAFNYKTENASEALMRLGPDGLDLYYDNVGGEQLEAALANLKVFGRIGEHSSTSLTLLQ